MRRRRRTALNEAVHELRRPLQALALAGPSGNERSLQMAATALERLDREINGGAQVAVWESLVVGDLLAEAAARCSVVAAAAGKRLVLRPAVEARIDGDPFALAQAVDNLLANAIEHGGPRIVLAATPVAEGVRISVRDCARPLAARPSRPRSRTPLGPRLFGAARHGHGLRLVRRTASAHGGRFELRHSPGGAEAILELPATHSPDQGAVDPSSGAR